MRIIIVKSHIFLFLLCAAACTQKEIEEDVQPSAVSEQVCEVDFHASIETYDGTLNTRGATNTIWKDKDCVYLDFKTETGYIKATLTYEASTGNWKLSNNSLPPTSATNTCVAHYFCEEATKQAKHVSLSPHALWYKDAQASYTFKNGVLTISVRLAPTTGRVRFKGEPGTVFKVYGLQYFSSFDTSKLVAEDNIVIGKKEEKESMPVELTIGPDGYSKYVYATLPTVERERTMDIEVGEYMFSTYCHNGILQPGKSGMMNLPTEDNHQGWRMTKDRFILMDKIIFRMVFVEGGTFLMGSDELGENRPSVTVGDFFIGETEVSTSIYYKVIQKLDEKDLIPVKLYYKEALLFIDSISSFAHTDFRCPTQAEWEYAARGGKYSCGYIYSGSDNYDDVARYEKESYQDGLYTRTRFCLVSMNIGSLVANELGIYNMSGNVWELCRGNLLYDYGDGDYAHEYWGRGDYGMTVAGSRKFNPGIDHIGLRLAMDVE